MPAVEPAGYQNKISLLIPNTKETSTFFDFEMLDVQYSTVSLVASMVTFMVFYKLFALQVSTVEPQGSYTVVNSNVIISFDN